jgi:hypothetical protein
MRMQASAAIDDADEERTHNIMIPDNKDDIVQTYLGKYLCVFVVVCSCLILGLDNTRPYIT